VTDERALVREFVTGPAAATARALRDDWTMGDPTTHSFRVSFPDLVAFDAELAAFVQSAPAEAADLFAIVLEDEYWDRSPDDDIVLRVRDLPERHTYRGTDLRRSHLGQLVAIEAEVVGTDPVVPWLEVGTFECAQCGALTEFTQTYGDIQEPPACADCESDTWRLDMDASTLRDFQAVLTVPRESPMDDPPVLAVYVLGGEVGRVDEGDEVTVTGIYRTMPLDLQKESRLNVFLDGWDVGVDSSTAVDTPAAELDEMIAAAIEDQEDVAAGHIGADRAAVIDAVAAQGPRRAEVESRIEHLCEVDKLQTTADRLVVADLTPTADAE
jgi:DNA replicative helicase MCM subunit Mcm2 (Cdc46/Mcm family)